MKNQFYKIYLIIILIGAIIIWTFGTLFERYVTNADEYQLNIEKVIQYQIEHHNEPIIFLNKDHLTLPENLQWQLSQGKVIALQNSEKQTYFYQLNQSNNKIIQFGPIEYLESEQLSSNLIVIFFYICLAGLLIFVIRPVFVDLQRLQDKANQFSRNGVPPELNIHSRSSIFPLASTFQSMATKIAELLSIHKYLSRTIAHDIRTPLSRMKFVIEALGENISLKYRKRFYQDINEIEVLAEDYLNFSRMESSFMSYSQEEIEISFWLRNLVEKFEMSNDNIKLEINCQQSRVFCHPKHLERAIQNLISNALKFAHSTIRISFVKTENDKRLIVEDDGPGINENSQQLFAKYKYAPTEENNKSFGFGLYITKKVAEWHGGEIVATKSPDFAGARFEFIWPCYDLENVINPKT